MEDMQSRSNCKTLQLHDLGDFELVADSYCWRIRAPQEAFYEALIDFGEGETIEEGLFGEGDSESPRTVHFVTTISALSFAGALKIEIKDMLEQSYRAEVIRTGVKLAIFGPPNAGKSSLLNYLGKVINGTYPSEVWNSP